MSRQAQWPKFNDVNNPIKASSSSCIAAVFEVTLEQDRRTVETAAQEQSTAGTVG